MASPQRVVDGVEHERHQLVDLAAEAESLTVVVSLAPRNVSSAALCAGCIGWWTSRWRERVEVLPDGGRLEPDEASPASGR